MINLNNIEQIDMNSLQVTCSPAMTQVFDYIKNKEIDESKIPYKDEDYIPPEGSIGWYKHTYGIAFIDKSDAIYNYTIWILTRGILGLPECCATNPVEECVCLESMPCISVYTTDKAGNSIGNTIPQVVMDNALKTLPMKGNIILYGFMALGLAVAAYYGLRRNR